jgi:cytochrome b6-f complex iron-sulfur subunit/menaquinol-cytochrome c reductase iron-sulfur subunit
MSNGGSNRRNFLGVLSGMLMALLGLLLAVPALAYVVAPLWKRRDTETSASFADLGPVAELPEGQWQLRALEVVRADGWKKTRARHAVWVRRQGDQVSALSSICPHLGCPINWHPQRDQFDCPCHGGAFDARGDRVAGPPPRGMDTLETEVRAGRLWVRWQDFKTGVAERIPLT